MLNCEALSNRIDDAFGPLLMAKDILDRVIPESEHEPARMLAGHLAVELVDLAMRQLCPDRLNSVEDAVRGFAADRPADRQL